MTRLGRVPQHEPIRHWMANRSESPLVGMEAGKEGETQAFRGQEVLLKPPLGRCAAPPKGDKRRGPSAQDGRRPPRDSAQATTFFLRCRLHHPIYSPSPCQVAW